MDKGWLPEGASTRNAGFACVGSITEHLADLQKESEEGIRSRIQKRYEGLELLKQTLGAEEISYEPCGGYELFTDPEKYEEAADRIPQFNRWLNELVGEEQVYSAQRLNGYPVIHNRLEGALHPGKMMQRYIHLASQEGVEIKWNTPVAHVRAEGIVELESGMELKAYKVLLAANGFVRRLLPDLAVKPARGLVFVTQPLEGMRWKGTFHYDKGYIYFRNVGNRLLLGGARNLDAGTETTDRFGTNDKIKAYLVNFASDVLKLEEEWQIEHEWSGIMGFTESKTPVLQQLDDHRFVAAGLSGMGVAIGTRIGQQAAGLLNGK